MNDDKKKVFDKIAAQINGAFEEWYQGNPLATLELLQDEMSYFSPFVNCRVQGKKAIEAFSHL